MKLEDLKPNAVLKGIRPERQVTVLDPAWFGANAFELTYKASADMVGNTRMCHPNEPEIILVEAEGLRGFDSDESPFELISVPRQTWLAQQLIAREVLN